MKIDVLKNFAILTGKQLLESLFHEIVQACNFINKRLQYMCFSVNIAKLLRVPILKNICEQLFLS